MRQLIVPKFYVFSLIFSAIAVYWSFSYISQESRQIFSYAMWGLFIFYLVGFLGVGGLLCEEMIEVYLHHRKLRFLEHNRAQAEIGKIDADAYLVRSKGDATTPKPGSILEGGPNTPIVVDLSEAIKIPKVYPLIETIVKYPEYLLLVGKVPVKLRLCCGWQRRRND